MFLKKNQFHPATRPQATNRFGKIFTENRIKG